MRARICFLSLLLGAACSGTADDDQVEPPKTRDGGPAGRDAGETLPRDGGADPRDGGADPRDGGEVARDGGPRDGGPRDGGPRDGGEVADFDFYTPAFNDGDMVPAQYTCDGRGGFGHQFNPELIWENPPPGTAAFVMIFDDPDAGNFGHWAFYTDDATVLRIPEGTSNTMNLPMGVNELRSSDGRTGYVPNCPGGRQHQYRWRMWAVDNTFMLNGRLSFDALERAATAAELDMVQFTGLSSAGGR